MNPARPPDDLPLAVTLTFAQWRTTLNLLAEGLHQLRVVGPIYGEIERQCNAALTQRYPIPAPNGEAREDARNG